MRKFAIALFLALVPTLVTGAGGGGSALMDAKEDVTDTASLQRGAKLFANYCMGCHSMKFLRYSRLAADLDIPEDVARKYLIWDGSEITDTMTIAMRDADARDWFGAVPPDLSLTARARGADWVYTYLNTFYRDEGTSTGFNNLLLPGASMPHVLWRLQGIGEPVREETAQGDIAVVDVDFSDAGGAMSQEAYHRATRDITNFMVYASEPIKATRESMGVWVVLFLLAFTGLAYLLKREYWRDVH